MVAPYAGTAGAALFPIRSKLSSALQKWHPSDSSAKLILQPWKDVFTPGSWEAFMVKNIVPKLGMCLGELVINPTSSTWMHSIG